ncbi:MAG TPA: hypothetical protein VIJ84_04230 [Gaiellaceae bacterium]
MTERDRDLAVVLDEFFPRRNEERGDWDGVVADAGSRWPRVLALKPRRIALALAIFGVLVTLAVVPALAVSKGWWFLTYDGAVEPSGPVVVAINPRADDPWTLVAFLTNSLNGSTELCYSWTPSNEDVGGGAMGCGPSAAALGEPNLPDLGATFATTSGVAYGPATLDVATVEAALGDGSTVQARIVTAPKALGAPLRFYIARFPAEESVTKIIGRNSEGRVIGTITVPHWTKPPQDS